MYKSIARRRVKGVFAAIGRRDHEAMLKDVAPDVHHVFPGENALGGERHSREAMKRWFERLDLLFPQIEFEVGRVAVKGPPWNMEVAVEWTDRGKAADGGAYENRGAHWIHLRRGKAVSIHAYLDTDKVTASCERMAAAGIAEAGAAPITD
jgi:ketosteroid isomerase-like protein